MANMVPSENPISAPLLVPELITLIFNPNFRQGMRFVKQAWIQIPRLNTSAMAGQTRSGASHIRIPLFAQQPQQRDTFGWPVSAGTARPADFNKTANDMQLQRFFYFGLGMALAVGQGAVAYGQNAKGLQLLSSAFDAGQNIPAIYTCDGRDISPPLTWLGVPPQAQSLALIIDDPDAPDPAAPQRTWVHWVLYDIPASTTGLAEEVARAGLPAGTREGLNDWKRTGYGGPCPPIGRHRYIHHLYALDVVLPDLGSPTKARLEQAMRNHVIDRTELIGLYRRP